MIESYLDTLGIRVHSHDADALLKAFLTEMNAGLIWQPSSLAMLPAHLKVSQAPPSGKAVAVVDAGGTNLRTALVRFKANGEALIEKLFKQPMPGRLKAETANDFYDAVASALTPYYEAVSSVGFCFSYDTTINGDLDGVLNRWSKEIQIPDMVDRPVGAGLVGVVYAGKVGLACAFL